jgi:hypothetical protein
MKPVLINLNFLLTSENAFKRLQHQAVDDLGEGELQYQVCEDTDLGRGLQLRTSFGLKSATHFSSTPSKAHSTKQE